MPSNTNVTAEPAPATEAPKEEAKPDVETKGAIPEITEPKTADTATGMFYHFYLFLFTED